MEDILAHTKGQARFSIITGNHDVVRIRRGRTVADLKVAYTFIFTMPGRPFLYYGDEIGMEHLAQAGNKEGAYSRGGNRTPMQWNTSLNAGFSAADSKDLYFLIDPATDRPCVSEQEKDDDSLLNFTRKLIALRHQFPTLGAEGKFRCLNEDRTQLPLCYERTSAKDRFIIVVNPDAHKQTMHLPENTKLQLIASTGVVSSTANGNGIDILLDGVSAAIFQAF